jgi:recombinational DNA repair protein RecT
MQTQQQGRSGGNGQQQQRGVQGRPDVKAREKFGEERVAEILAEKKNEITALFANDRDPNAMYERACALSIGAYRKIQDDANESAARQNKSPQRIDEVSAVACCIMAMQRKLDPGTDLYLVPYGGKVTAILSPEGVIKLLFRTGMVKAVNARYVFRGSPNPQEGEEYFDYVLGSTNDVKHRKNNARPRAAKDNRGQVAENEHEWNALSHAYAIIDLKDGGQTIEVLDKADIAYFRSLSPTGDSKYGGWAKFPAAFGRKAALKQAAKFVPKESEVSIILAADDTERGIEIPDEIMQAVGARMLREMTGEGNAPNGEAVPPETKPGAGPARIPQPGNAQALYMPGKSPQPKIAEADDAALADAEKRGRDGFDNNKWPDQYRERNITQVATIRAEMRRRNLAVPYHPFFDGEQQQQPPQQEPEQEQDYGYGGDGMREPGMEG